MIHYPIPVHKQISYSSLNLNYRLPITEDVSKKILSLPLNQWLIVEEIEKICEIMNNYGDIYD